MSANPLIDRVRDLGGISAYRHTANAYGVFKTELSTVTEANLSALVAEQVALAVAEYKKDAERYRWLRMCNWHESSICVVTHPKNSVRLGHVCPSEDRLDKAIDDAISSTEQTKGA